MRLPGVQYTSWISIGRYYNFAPISLVYLRLFVAHFSWFHLTLLVYIPQKSVREFCVIWLLFAICLSTTFLRNLLPLLPKMSTTPMDAMIDRDLTNLAEKVSFLTNGAIHIDSTTRIDSPSLLESVVNPEADEQSPYPCFETGPFEGVEKRLIVEFYPSALRSSPILTNGSLRSLSASQWQTMLDRAACQILSHKELETESGSCTAYLLSESSLFVYDHRVVLKTCGYVMKEALFRNVYHFWTLILICSLFNSKCLSDWSVSYY